MEEERLTSVDGSLEVTKEEAKKLLKENHNRVSNGSIESFVCLKDINKIYPNGVQAVYDFNINIEKHDFLVLVGPSGCGKSTTLRMIAGLEPITSGYLYIDQILSNYVSSKNRDISMVFQSYALYPNMTVYDNIAFPLKVRKYRKVKVCEEAKKYADVLKIIEKKDELFELVELANEKNYKEKIRLQLYTHKLGVSDAACNEILPHLDELAGVPQDLKAHYEELLTQTVNVITATEGVTLSEDYEILVNGEKQYYEAKLTKQEIREKVFSAAEVLDLGPYLDRKPNELSGGQMQRVALGRAMVRNAKLFLMDEPLSNLDAKLRVQMRSELVRLHESIGATTIYVTHDQTEAMTMATKIAVMNKGWVQQIGEPQEIYNNPANMFVATFIGSPAMNIVKATYKEGVVTFADGYSIKLGKEAIANHDKFYNENIADVERMLKTDDFVKMHAIDVLGKYELEENPEVKQALLDEVASICEALSEEERDIIKGALETNNMKALKEQLYKFSTITSQDLAKLHNAQLYLYKGEKKSNDNLVIYDKKRKSAKKAKRRTSFRVNDLTFSNNLYLVAMDLLAEFEKSLKEEHEVNFGIRPECIHLSNEFTGNKTNELAVKPDVVELMGSELLIHCSWNGVDLISKISTGTIVHTHEIAKLVFDLDKVLLFDASTGLTIK